MLVEETKFTSAKLSSPAAYKQKKFVAKSSLPAANGGAIARSNLSEHAAKLSETSLPLANEGTIVCSNLSKHATKLSESSSPAANAGAITQSNLSKHAMKLSDKPSLAAANGGKSAGDTIVSVVTPNEP